MSSFFLDPNPIIMSNRLTKMMSIPNSIIPRAKVFVNNVSIKSISDVKGLIVNLV